MPLLAKVIGWTRTAVVWLTSPSSLLLMGPIIGFISGRSAYLLGMKYLMAATLGTLCMIQTVSPMCMIQTVSQSNVDSTQSKIPKS